MSNSIKMARLDYFSMKSQRVFWVSVFLMVYFGYMNSNLTVMFITSAWFSALISGSIFSVQERNNLARLYGSVSIALKDIVLGRYLFMICFYAISLLLGAAFFTAFGIFMNRLPDFSDLFPGLALSVLVFSVITGIQTPLFFRFGYMRARFFSLIPFVLMMLIPLIPSLSGSVSGLIESWVSAKTLLSINAIVAGVIIMFVSYLISIPIYRGRKG